MNKEKNDYLNSQETFGNFPHIPPAKIWNNTQTPGEATDEQIISQKLIQSIPLTGAEINKIVDCISFYTKLNEKLKKFDFTSLNPINLEDFIGYIGYAYNYSLVISNSYEISQTFRLVRNNNGKRKKNISEISYPPLSLVKKWNCFNRANSSNTTLFYSCEKINACFLELKPEVGEIVTIGIWHPNDIKKRINCYPIPASLEAQKVNEEAFSAQKAFQVKKQKMSPLLSKHLNGYFDLLNYEYAKSVNNHYEYVVSAYFSENILKIKEGEFAFEAILFPSVGNNYYSSNLVMLPQVVDDHFFPAKIIEMEILATNYNLADQNYAAELLTVADVRIVKEADSIDSNGNILWK